MFVVQLGQAFFFFFLQEINVSFTKDTNKPIP